jgi:glycosyltransferase 2 family protein
LNLRGRAGNKGEDLSVQEPTPRRAARAPRSLRDRAPRYRGALSTALKLAIALGAGGWLVSRGYLDFSAMSASSLVVGFALTGLQGVGNAIRLRWLFKLHGLPVSFARAMTLTWLALAFNQLLPGGAGGDVVRAYYAAQDHPEAKASAVVAVLFDKVIGLAGLLMLGVVPWVIAIAYGDHMPAETARVIRVIGATMAAAFAGAAALAFVALSPRAGAWAARSGLRPWITWVEERLGRLAGPGSRSGQAGPLSSLLAAHRGARLRLLGLTAFSAALHLISCVALYLIAGDSRSFALHLAIWSAVFLTTILPLSPGGIGVSEAAAAKLWLLEGVSTGAATYLGFRMVSALHAAIGLCLYVGMRKRRVASAPVAALADALVDRGPPPGRA